MNRLWVTWHPVIARGCADSLPLHLHLFLKTAQQRCVVRAVLLYKSTFYMSSIYCLRPDLFIIEELILKVLY